jgi:ethanolaminephosphotransferase
LLASQNFLALRYPAHSRPQGLAFVGVNVLTMIIYLPALSCTPKPLLKVRCAHFGQTLADFRGQSLGGSWDPLFLPKLEHKLYQNSISFVQNLLGIAKDKLQGVECPNRLIYFSWAIGLWFYQSLDAIDGKQARRTGTSGPLGELFDHCCDAVGELGISAVSLTLFFPTD